MSHSLQVIVTGANGWIGRKVCSKLKELGHAVIACDLEESNGPWNQFIEIDISNETSFPDRHEFSSTPNEYILIHCAGYAHRPIETPEEKKLFFAINAEGTLRTIDWARTIGVHRFVYLSSIAFYDWSSQQDMLPLQEDASLTGFTAYAQSKLDGEKYVRASGLDSRIVRLGTVFGNGDKANFSKLAKALKSKRFILPGEGEARKSVISVEKAAEWIVQYTLMKNPKHKLINLGFSDAPFLKDICEAYHDVCGFPQPFQMSVGLLRLIARCGNLVSKMKPGFPLTTQNVGKLTQSTWVDCSKAAEMISEVDKCTFKEALKESADYYRSL